MKQRSAPLDKYFSYAVAAAHRKLHTHLNGQLRAFGIQVETWRILETLDQTDGLTMSGLAEIVLMNPPAMTKLVDRMVADGLVQRQIGIEDQRRVTLILTDMGAELVLNVRLPASEQNDAILAQLGPEKVQLIHEALDILDQNL
ncbi:MAG: MarR family transcriptional regulator [Amylibacter sp.]|jgi:MarR family transcriptional regulator, organic hydroperoxide resistance regulator|nr:MarR family transcriptional regulator [Amylibacter sp.]